MTAVFRGFERTTPVPLDGATSSNGRLQLQLPLVAAVTNYYDTPVGVVSESDPPLTTSRAVDLYGPRDVAGLASGAVTRSSPPPGAGDVDGEYCVFVEFRAPDLPWRYSHHTVAPDGDAMVPWLALVAGIEGVELGIDPDGTLWMRPPLTDDLDPRRAAAWAHTHEDEAGNGRVARLLCARELRAGSRCLASVVPLHHANGKERWSPGATARGLPVLHHFRFVTNDAGSFEDLVVKLQPVPVPDGLGRVTLHAQPSGGGPVTTTTYGALAAHGAPPRPPLDDPTVGPRLEALLEPPQSTTPGEPEHLPQPGDPRPRHPVLGAPRWSAPFQFDPGAQWVGEVDTDPRHRAAAGLGARIAVDWQDRIVDAAATRLGETHLAAALLRHLTGGVALAQRTGMRRPHDAAALLAFHGPALRNVWVDGPQGTTDALRHLCPPSRALPPALLSSAAGHLFRATGATAKASSEPRAVADPGRVVTEALNCPADPAVPIEPRDVPSGDIDVERAFEVLREVGEEVDPTDLRAAVNALPPDEEFEGPGCDEPYDGWVDDAAAGLDDAFRPDGVPVDRVTGRIHVLHEPWDVPLEVRPDLDLPVWDWLRTQEPDWLLPRAGLIPPDGVVALRTDRAFVAAVLTGASREALRELRWRGVPVSAGAMPMRTFWQHVASPDNPPPMVDLVQPASWPSVGLGDLRGPRGSGSELVIAFRSDLVRRYPDTQVYLVGRQSAPDFGSPIPPAFTGRLEPDVWFFGFPVAPEQLDDYFVVLEEPDRGPRFRPPAGTSGAGYRVIEKKYAADGTASDEEHDNLIDGGSYAQAAYVRPIRALLDGRKLRGGGG